MKKFIESTCEISIESRRRRGGFSRLTSLVRSGEGAGEGEEEGSVDLPH